MPAKQELYFQELQQQSYLGEDLNFRLAEPMGSEVSSLVSQNVRLQE